MIAKENDSTTETDGPNSGPSDVPDRAESSASGSENEPSPFDPLLRHLSELQMLAGHYVRARADQISARVRTLLFWAVAAVIGLIIAVAFLVTAVVLVLRGIATGLILLGLQPWAADLITGAICIGAVAATVAIVWLSQTRSARRKRRDDNEHFRARYRAKFGRSLDESARSETVRNETGSSETGSDGK
jgi:hypothetical protein